MRGFEALVAYHEESRPAEQRDRQQDLREGDGKLERTRDTEQREGARVLEAIAPHRMRRVEGEGVGHGRRHFIAASRTCWGRIDVRQRKSPGSQIR